jgi:hypothetical protein
MEGFRVDGADDDAQGIPPASYCYIPLLSPSAVCQPAEKCLSVVKIITTNICVNRMARQVVGNVWKCA